MATENLPEKPGKILIRQLRAFLRDDPTLNELIEGKESSDGQLKQALLDALEDWNTTPPLLAPVNVANHPSRRLLVRSAAIEILVSMGIYFARNDLTYSDGGITVADKNKAGIYAQYVQKLQADFERKKLDLKKARNLDLAYGIVPSEYGAIWDDDEHF